MLLQSQLLCWSGVQVEGIAVNKGLVVEEPGRRFEKGYKRTTLSLFCQKPLYMFTGKVPTVVCT